MDNDSVDIPILSRKLGQRPKILTVTEDVIKYDDVEITIDSITDIGTTSEKTGIDQYLLSWSLLQGILGSIATSMLNVNWPYIVFMFGIFATLGWGIGRFVRDTPHVNIKIETGDGTEYIIGVATQYGLATLYNNVLPSVKPDRYTDQNESVMDFGSNDVDSMEDLEEKYSDILSSDTSSPDELSDSSSDES